VEDKEEIMKKKILISVILAFSFIALSFTPILGKTIPSVSSPELIAETYSGMAPIIRSINSAKKSIHLEIYGFTQYDLAEALGDASSRGVEVDVMLEKSPVGGDTENWNIRYMLRRYGIHVKWANPAYFLTHAKFLIVDDKEVFVFTGNFTYSTFHKNREFGLRVTDPDVVGEVNSIFQKDWNRRPVDNVTSPDILLSPIDAREKIENLLKSANVSLDIWQQEMEDPEINNIIRDKIKEGVKVRVIIPPLYRVSGNSDALDLLGVEHVRALPDLYVHAKVIIVDNNKVYIGSNNFSTGLDNNREMGLITDDPNIINTLEEMFKIDWNKTIDPDEG
jgi:cardiolipin synthase